LRLFALLLIALSNFASSSAFELSGNIWQSHQAVFHVGISGSSPTGGTWNDAFKRSMAAWSEVSTFDFVALDEYVDPCIDRGEGQFGDQVVGIDFTESVCGTQFGANTLAVTLTAGRCLNPQCTGGFAITDSDIVFNNAETWDIYSGPRRIGRTAEFERVALHELGHALGLNHSTESAIMQAFVSDTHKLQSDDIAGVVAIYGAPELLQDANTPNIFGVSLVAPSNSIITGSYANRSFSGILNGTDDQLNGKALDLYQYTLENDSTINVRLDSEAFDPLLYLVRVTATQASIPNSTFINDNSGSGNNARIDRSIQAGTYWLGVTSAGTSAQGIYSVSIVSTTDSPASSFETFTSIYGVDVLINPNPNIGGTLEAVDSKFNDRFLDLIQIEVASVSRVKIDLSSSAFDTSLLIVDVVNNAVGNFALQDDNSGSGTNSRIETILQPGTYWLGVTSSASNESGDYAIAVSLVVP